VKWLIWIYGFALEVDISVIIGYDIAHFSRDTFLLNLLTLVMGIIGMVFVGLGMSGKIRKK
jgi:hypothetical protein